MIVTIREKMNIFPCGLALGKVNMGKPIYRLINIESGKFRDYTATGN